MKKMKRIILLVMYILCPVCVLAQFSGKGSGTESDPYQITNADELFEVRNSLSASYKLMNDVDLTEWIAEDNPTQGWSPIGNFMGTFDGNGKTIKGLFLRRPTTDYVGLFSQLKYTCVIKDLCLYKPNIYGKDYVGSIAGLSNGNIDDGKLKNVSINSIIIVEPQINGQTHVGGLIGYAEQTHITNNSVVLPKIVANSYIGGIVGMHYAYNATYFNMYSNVLNNTVCGGTITGQAETGGIIGYSSGSSEWVVGNNYCSSVIDGTNYVGGICGKIDATYFIGYIYNGTSKPDRYSMFCNYAVNNNHFAGSIKATQNSGGIVGGLYCHYELNNITFVTYNTFTTKANVNIFNNICSGDVSSNENTSGVLGNIPSLIYGSDVERTINGFNTDNLQRNVFCGDSLTSLYTESNVYRISSHEGFENYALSTASLFVDNQPFIVEEDNAQQGTGYGKKTLMKQSTYEGLGFDFSNNWAIVEGETYPYNIKQCRPATITSFKSGTSGTIEGTAIGKSSNCQGSVYVAIGEKFFEGDVTNGRWTVQLGNVAEGTEAKVAVMVDGMMPSILTTALAEKGSNMPSTDDIVNTDISSLSDAIYAETRTALKGGNGTLTISMKNAQATSAYSFDLVLPDGVTVNSYTLSSRHNGHAETMNRNETTGVYSFAVLSLQSKEIKDNDGVIWTLKLNIADDVETGDYAVKIQNAKYSLTSGSTSVVLPDVTSILTIEDHTKGDANGDSGVDIADAVCIVNHVVGKDAPTFVEAAADANGDGTVDIADAVRIVNLVVGKISALEPKMEITLPEPQ